MGRRSKVGVAAAMIVGVLMALTLALGAVGGRWRLALHVSADGVEISVASENVRLELTL